MIKRPRSLALFAVGSILLAACSTGSANVAPQTAGEDAAPSTTSSSSSEHQMEAMNSNGESDDRGFAALENGEQHGPEFQQAISDEDRIELARQLTLAREVALQYPTVADAEAFGLVRAGPFAPGLGAHYISYENAAANADGLMSDDDIRQPLAWIYDGTHQNSRISGLFYGTIAENAEGLAGPNDIWHGHSNICIVTAPDGRIDTPLGADRDANTEDCDKVGGTMIFRSQYLLHVWVVPGYESPEGVFSHLSSSVTCDDGSYNTVDFTEIGTRSTLCIDGTE